MNNYGLASTRTFTRSFPLPWRAMPQHADATETETRQTKNSKHTRLSSGAPKCTERGFLWCIQHIIWAPMMSPALFSVLGTEEKLPLPGGSGVRVIGDTEWVFLEPGSCRHSTDHRRNHVRTAREYTVFLPSLLMPCRALTTTSRMS